MDFESLFKSLPSLIELFVPGFMFIEIYKRFGKIKTEAFESVAIYSVVLSYVFSLISGLLSQIISLSNDVQKILTIILAVLCALGCVKIKTLSITKEIFRQIGKVSGNENIWQDIFDRNLGSKIRCFTKYNNQDVIIEGMVRYYEACDDGGCNLALIQYKILYQNGNVYFSKDKQLLHLNTNNVHGLEVLSGKAK